jgi:hypothetical protein
MNTSLKILLFVSSVLLILQCGWLDDKHEMPWRFEWRFLDASDSTSISTARLHWIMNLHEEGIPDNYSPEGHPYTLEGQIDNRGYLLAVFYTSAQHHDEDPPDFYVKCLLQKSNETVFDTTITRDQCIFKDQLSDIDKNTEYTNVNKKTFYIKI